MDEHDTLAWRRWLQAPDGQCNAGWISGSDTSVNPPHPHVPLSPVATNIGGVSAAERLVLTPERIPDVVGRVAVVYAHGNFSDRDQVSWGCSVRQDFQPPHTQLVNQDDLDFETFIERNGPVPATGVGKFFKRKWAELQDEHPELAANYEKGEGDSLRKRYQRLKKRKERMGLSS